MSEVEFDDGAASIADEVRDWPLDERIAAACRGSGNPGALAWLAEGLALPAGGQVVDLGAGLGGPAAWLELRYGVPVVASDPGRGSVAGAASLFDLMAVQATAEDAPFRGDWFAAALLLGVVSVVERPLAVLREAGRLSSRLGLMDYCAVAEPDVEAGGSTFPSSDRLLEMVAETGWTITQSTPVSVPAPSRWSDLASSVGGGNGEAAASEAEVTDAIDAGRLAPFMLTARR